jgi:hydrogenase maturation protease
MAKMMVVGYGNPLCGDDGVGWHAAQVLADTLAVDDVEVLACHTLTPKLFDPVRHADLVIFVNSCMDDLPGQLTFRAIKSRIPNSGSKRRQLNPQSLLSCVQELYGTSPRALIITMGGENFNYGDDLSPFVATSFPALLDSVRDQLAQWRSIVLHEEN